MDAANLTQIALFEGLSDAQLKQIGGWADEIDVDTGYHLIRRDGFGYEFFAIIDGTAEVMDGERHLADLSAGDFFGEMALLDEERRSASVRATSPMRLMVMTRQEFHSMIAAVPGIDERIRAKIAERLDNSARYTPRAYLAGCGCSPRSERVADANASLICSTRSGVKRPWPSARSISASARASSRVIVSDMVLGAFTVGVNDGG